MKTIFNGAMRNIFTIAIALFAASMLGGCTSALYSGYNNDDLYATHDREAIAKSEAAAHAAHYEALAAQAEARRAEYEALVAAAEAIKGDKDYNVISNPNDLDYTSVVADTYESAYARRLRGFDSPYYNMPSSYYNLRYSGAYSFLSAYDPAFYNIIVMGDQVWVEPKYITSMFGGWGTSVNFSFGWRNPWSYYYSPWHYPSSWYWRHYCWDPWYDSWYGMNWGFGWRPHYDWWWPHYGPNHGPAHGPVHKPSQGGGGGSNGHPTIIHRSPYRTGSTIGGSSRNGATVGGGSYRNRNSSGVSNTNNKSSNSNGTPSRYRNSSSRTSSSSRSSYSSGSSSRSSGSSYSSGSSRSSGGGGGYSSGGGSSSRSTGGNYGGGGTTTRGR